MHSEVDDSQHVSTSGVFNFMAADSAPSLFRNGQVLIERDADGNTARSHGIQLDAHTMTVHNARELTGAARPSCDRNGFELLDQPVAVGVDFQDHKQVVERYYPECAELVAAITGAKAYAFDHNVRSASGKREQAKIAGGQHVQEPAHIVHGDYTLRSAPDRLQQLCAPPSGNDTLLGVLPAGASLIDTGQAEHALTADGRFAIINVWRNIDTQPVATHPLALCDSQTVAPEDLVVFEIHYANRIGENYFAKYAERQQMYYYPHITADEALLIKQWDSAGPLARSNGAQGDASAADQPCTFSFHSAFEDPATPSDAPDRWSIEVRCMVVYD